MNDSVPSSDLSGAILSGRVQLVRRIGVGGMAVVYEATTIGRGARVAVKLLRSEFVGDRNVHDRFLDEAKVCLGLNHPTVVNFLDVGTAEDGTPYLVMEYLDGVPLSAYTAHSAKTPMKNAIPIMVSVLQGLAYAHGAGVVHRDLKPENIFLARDAEGKFLPKILDFGVAKLLDAAGGIGKKTSTGMLLGTPAYMSPEQVQNAREVDPRSDLFSLGTILYEMLSGKVAFDAPSEFEQMSAVLSYEPPTLAELDPTLAPISPIVARAMRKDRAARFQTATEMADALLALEPAPALAISMAPPPPSPPSAVEANAPYRTLASAPEKMSAPVFPVPSVVIDSPTFVPELRRPAARTVPRWVIPLALAVGIVIGILATIVVIHLG